ncbi:MAG: hypothetical protein WC149_07345 [Arcobacteraceae bacterium]
MYLHFTSNILNTNGSVKTYRELLKPLSTINLRRSSKFNILAVYGALLCVHQKEVNSDIAIYVATEYGPIMDVNHVLNTINSEDNIIMPFDFLNINSNNVSFYVAKALNATGKNMVLTSKALSFEKTMQLAFFDLHTNEVKNVLIGAVDESVEEIPEYDKYTPNLFNQISCDGSYWFYANTCSTNALASIHSIKEYSSYDDVKKSLTFYNKVISLNQYAASDTILQNLIESESGKIIRTNAFFGCDGALNFHALLKHKGEAIHIGKDNSGKFIVIELTL